MEEDTKFKNDLLYKEAIALVENNNFNETIKYCNYMIRNDPNDADGWDIKAYVILLKIIFQRHEGNNILFKQLRFKFLHMLTIIKEYS